MNVLRIAYHTIIDRTGEHEHVAGWRNRCTYCGHRVAVAGVAPIQTREQPWRVFSEVVGRFVAMAKASNETSGLMLIVAIACVLLCVTTILS